MPKVFISHSSLDREFVEREIIPPLRSHGIDTWYSTDNIRTAELWEKSIREGLKSCDWFLIVMSPNSVNSKWVPREMLWAMDRREGRIIPVLIETCAPEDLHLGLLAIQHIDFRHDIKRAQSELLAIWGVSDEVNDLYQAALAATGEENWAEAIAHLRKLLELSADHAEAKDRLRQARQQRFLANLYDAGLKHFQAKRWQESLEDLRQVRELEGEYKEVDSLIANAEHELAKLEEARKAQEEHERRTREEEERKAHEEERKAREEEELKAREQAAQLISAGSDEAKDILRTDEIDEAAKDEPQPSAAPAVASTVALPDVSSATPATETEDVSESKDATESRETFAPPDQPERKVSRLVWVVGGALLISSVILIIVIRRSSNSPVASGTRGVPVTASPDNVTPDANSSRQADSPAANSPALVQEYSSPTPTPTPTTVQLRLTQVINNDGYMDGRITDSNTIVQAGGKTFQKLTDSKGAVVFDEVPCGEVVEITAYDTVTSADKVFRIKIGCDKRQVEFVLNQSFGAFNLERRKPKAPLIWDADKEKWFPER